MSSKAVSPLGFGLLLWCDAALAGVVSFQGLGSLPGTTFDSQATAVSADGTTVVGRSDQQGFRWSAATGMVGLQIPGCIGSPVPTGVSADGSVIAGYCITVVPEGDSFLWTVGAPTATSFIGWVSGVSGDGSVVVGSDVGSAFRWAQVGGFTHLGDLPGGGTQSGAAAVSADGLVVVGVGTSESGREAFRWTQSSRMIGLGDLPGGTFNSMTTAISADGSVVVGRGSSDESGVGYEAFRWTQLGGMIGFGDLPGGAFDSEARGISADGSVVVGRGTTIVGDEAFIWNATSGMRNLRDVLTGEYGLNLTGWQLTEAMGVSADGSTIVGTGINPSGDTEAWIAHVPEPAALTLLLIGVSLMMKRRGLVRARPSRQDL